MDIRIGKYISPSEGHLEVVERKGIGHPDTIADQLAEAVSIEYTKYCLKTFGVPLAHNVDKIGIMGGKPVIEFGHSYLVKPIRVLLNGRITRDFKGQLIPVWEIARKAMNDQLKKALPALDIEKQVIFIDESTDYSKFPNKFHPRDENDIPELKKAYANDTAVVVSYYPLTRTEKLNLELERFFYDKKGKPKYDYVGQDIKIMVHRIDKNFNITMCVPFMANKIRDEKDYWKKRDYLETKLQDLAQKLLTKSDTVELTVNTQDPYWGRRTEPKPARSYYLTVTGSALDYGEEGFVGRGNGRNGIISSCRSYTMEAPYGKNPVYHAGKVLAVVSDEIARQIYNKFKCDTEVWIMPNNGDPLFSPSKIVINTSKKIDKKVLTILTNKILGKTDWTKNIIENKLILPLI